MFQTLIVQPIYNLLVAIYGILPGHDLGISLILFTVIIRVALWPLLKKQLHQSKKMRDLQPELAKVKKAAKGDRQKEAALMMELYKEKGINPFGSIGLTLIQLPLFIGVFQAARDLTEHLYRIDSFTYSFVRQLPHVQEVIKDNNSFNYVSLGFIDLSQKAFNAGKIAWPIMIIALAATALSYIQAKQLLPQQKEKKRLRDVLKASAGSAQPAQEDMSAAMGGTMTYLMPLLTLMFAVYAQGAMVVYLLASSAIGIFQQSRIFKKDADEMDHVAEVLSVKKESVTSPTGTVKEKTHKGKVTTKTRIISPSSTATPKKKNKKRRK